MQGVGAIEVAGDGPHLLKPQIPAAGAPALCIAVAPRARPAVGNKRFYSWSNPLSQNWDAEGQAAARSGYWPETLPESLGLACLCGTEAQPR